MSYSENGDVITLEMSRADYRTLLLMLSNGLTLVDEENDPTKFWQWVDCVNRLNTGNPRYDPYQIPEEFRAEQAGDGGTEIAR